MTNETRQEIKVSVLIITRDRSYVLGDCLKRLRPQLDFSKHEVIVVDSSEDDRTAQVMRAFDWVAYYRIALPLGTRPQSYSHGSKLCRGEVIALIDDDSMIEPGWLAALEACYDDARVGVVGGRVMSPAPKSTVTEYRPDLPVGRIFSNGRMTSNLHLDTGRRLEVDTVRGCNMSIRKSILERGRYFDSRLKGQNMKVEDDVCMWARRMGYKVMFEPKAAVTHLAAKRPDLPRSSKDLRSNFFARRNAVWFFIKHFRIYPPLLLNIMLFDPLHRGLRIVVGGSFRAPRFKWEGALGILHLLSGLAGAWWGSFMTLVYCGQDWVSDRRYERIPKLDPRVLCRPRTVSKAVTT